MNKILLESAKFGNLKTVKQMLQLGADIDARNSWNGTPLYLACQYGHYDIVAYLLKSKANMHLTTDSGRTPLDIACTFEFEDIVALLEIYDLIVK